MSGGVSAFGGENEKTSTAGGGTSGKLSAGGGVPGGRMPVCGSLPDGGEERMLRVYLADIRPLFQEEMLQRAYTLLDEARRKKLDALGSAAGRAACAAAGLLMRYALEQDGQAGARVEYTTFGQPVPEKGCISISHSGIYAACVLDQGPVGVDIQELRRIRTGMLDRCLTAAERKALVQKWKDPDRGSGTLLPGPERDFLRYFSAKESYMKLTGQGMSMGFDRIRTDWEAGTVCDVDGVWPTARLYECAAPEGYVLIACRAEGTE